MQSKTKRYKAKGILKILENSTYCIISLIIPIFTPYEPQTMAFKTIIYQGVMKIINFFI